MKISTPAFNFYSLKQVFTTSLKRIGFALLIILMGANTTWAQTTITTGNTVAASTITANTAVTINAGGTLNMDVSKTFTSITTANTGTASTISGTGTLTLTGNVTIAASSTLSLNTACSAASLTTPNLNNTIATISGSGTLTLSGAVNINGSNNNPTTLAIGSSITVICTSIASGNGNPNTTYNLQLTGTIKNSGATALDVLTCNSGSTFEYTGVTQTVFHATYYNLTISAASGTKTLGTGTTGVTNSLTVASGSTLNFNASNLSAGDLQGDGTLTTSSTARLLTIGSNNASTTFSGIIAQGTGVVSFTKSGTGTLTLSGANTFTGVTTISAGVLSVATIGNGGVASGNLGSATNAAANLVLSGGTLQYTGSTASTNRNFTLTAATTSTIDVTTNNLTISGSTTATSGALTKIGNGTLTLTGTNIHTGVTTINAGVLSIGTIGNGASVTGNLSAASNAAGNLVLGGGTLQYTGSTATTDRAYTLTASTTSSIDVTTNILTMSGAGAATSGSLTKIGSGTLIFTAVNTYTGTTSVTAGTLSLGAAATQNTITGPISINGGTLNYSTTANDQIANTSTLTLSSGTFDPAAHTETIASLTMSGGALTKAGGTLTLSSASSITGGTLTFSAGTASLATGSTLALGAATFNYDVVSTAGSNNLNLGGDVSYAASGTGPAVFANTNTGLGQMRLGTGVTRTFNITAASPSIGQAEVQVGWIMSEGISAVALTKSGTGTLQVSGTNTYTGLTTVSAGILNNRNNQGTGTTAGGVIVSSGAALELQGGITVGAEALTVSGIGPSGNAGIDNISGGNIWGGTITLGADATIRNQSGNFTINNPSSIATAGFLLTLGGNSTGGEISGVISGTGSVRKVTVAGIWTLSGNNSYSGSTAIQAGTLKIGATGTSPNGPLGTTGGSTSITSGAVLDLNGFTLSTSEGLTLNGTGISSGGGLINTSGTAVSYNGAITLGSASSIKTNGDISLGSGGITGTQDLTKIGSATLNTGSGTITLNSLTLSAGNITLGGNASIAGDLSVNAGTLDMVTYTINRATSGGNLTISNGASLKIGSTNTFPSNYSTHSIGASSTVQYAGAAQTIATLNSSQSYGHLVMSGTGVKTLAGDIGVAGNWTRNSGPSFNANDKIVSFLGSAAASIIAPETPGVKDANGSFGGETFSFVIINKSAKANTVSLGSNICITKTMTLTRGTFDLVASDVVLASNASTTADLDSINISTADISYSSTGRFIPQRYIGNTSTIRTWRYLTAPLQATDTLSINAAWQEGVVSADYTQPNLSNPYPGFGTHITGPNNLYDAVKGFDQGAVGNGNSLKYFDNSGGVSHYTFPANTRSTRLMSQLGWAVFIRGDRSYVFGGSGNPSGNTILEPKGKINIGDVTSTVTGGGALFNVVGNPYPCQINMEGVSIGGNTQANYTLWDPKAYTNYTQTGKFIPFTWAGSYTSANSPVTTWLHPGTIESGEAFLARSAGTSVVFHETDKVVGNSTGNGLQSRPARPTSSISFFRSYLAYQPEAGAPYENVDGVLNLFSPTYNTAVDIYEDVVSAISGSTTGAIRIAKDGYQLAISKEKTIDSQDTIFLAISTLKALPHRLKFVAKDFVPSSSAILIDNYDPSNNRVLSLADNDTTVVDFMITSDLQSNRTDRFMVVFRPAVVLPVKFSSIKAAQQSGGVSVEWKVATEVNTKGYEVEKSADGEHFTAVNALAATGSTTNYSWLDAKPNSGNNYYRIRMVDQSGNSIYSDIVLVKIGMEISSSIAIYPNPVVGKVIGVQMNNMPKGKYGIKIINSVGQILLKKTIQHLGGSSTETLSLGKTIPHGVYKLVVIKPDNQITIINFAH